MEDRDGQAMLSREKARREEAWVILENAFEAQERVTGVIFGRVKVVHSRSVRRNSLSARQSG